MHFDVECPFFLRALSGAQVKLRVRKVGRLERNLSTPVKFSLQNYHDYIVPLFSNLKLSLTKQVSTKLAPCFSFHLIATLILNSCFAFQNTQFFSFTNINIYIGTPKLLLYHRLIKGSSPNFAYNVY